MNDPQQIPVYDTEVRSEESTGLKAVFADIESKQLEFLDQAGKSIIERVTTFLTVLFAVTAFGGSFPPAYLKGSTWGKYLIIAILICYLVAIAMGMVAIQPRRYDLYRYNVTRMRKELDRILNWKRRWVQWAGILFALGTLALAGLVVSLIWNV
jgi:hypothetical protein